MSLGIKEIRPSLPEEWDSVWRHCSYATFFHSREWAEIWSRYKQGKLRPNPLTVVFTDGKEALLPLSCMVAKGSVWGFVSSPDGNYGGWIAVDPIVEAHAILLKEFLTKELGRLYWYLNPFDIVATSILIDANKLDETHVVNLQAGIDAVYSSWTHACRKNVKKAQRSGVLVKRAHTETEWHEFYKAYEDSLCRWGDKALSRYEWALFQEMFERQSDHIKLWLATTEDEQVIAGVVVCYAKTHASAWQGAAVDRYFNLRPVNRLYHDIIREACEGGYRWFDFGQSAGLEGVRRFKESFGATTRDFCIVHVKPADN